MMMSTLHLFFSNCSPDKREIRYRCEDVHNLFILDQNSELIMMFGLDCLMRKIQVGLATEVPQMKHLGLID